MAALVKLLTGAGPAGGGRNGRRKKGGAKGGRRHVAPGISNLGLTHTPLTALAGLQLLMRRQQCCVCHILQRQLGCLPLLGTE